MQNEHVDVCFVCTARCIGETDIMQGRLDRSMHLFCHRGPGVIWHIVGTLALDGRKFGLDLTTALVWILVYHEWLFYIWTHVEVFSSDGAVVDGSADTFSHQVLAVVLGLGSRIHCAEP